MYKSIKVTVSVWKKLKQLALDKETSISNIINELVSCENENKKY